MNAYYLTRFSRHWVVKESVLIISCDITSDYTTEQQNKTFNRVLRSFSSCRGPRRHLTDEYFIGCVLPTTRCTLRLQFGVTVTVVIIVVNNVVHKIISQTLVYITRLAESQIRRTRKTFYISVLAQTTEHSRTTCGVENFQS